MLFNTAAIKSDLDFANSVKVSLRSSTCFTSRFLTITSPIIALTYTLLKTNIQLSTILCRLDNVACSFHNPRVKRSINPFTSLLTRACDRLYSEPVALCDALCRSASNS
jgi:hypothetical protein